MSVMIYYIAVAVNGYSCTSCTKSIQLQLWQPKNLEQ
mgnify:CR=1 FL=1